MKKLIICLAIATTALYANAQVADVPSKQRIINVTGSAEKEVVPDEIWANVQLREYEKKGVKVDIEIIRNEFLKAALAAGIPSTDISIQSYNGWDGNQWWPKKKKKDPSLMAGITYEIKLSSPQKMDELVNRLNDEATENFSIARVSHSRIEDFKKELKTEALKAAKDKAGYLAAALGETVGQALIINEPNEMDGHYPQPMYANRMMKAEQADTPVPNIDFKKMKLRFEVSATFSLQ